MTDRRSANRVSALAALGPNRGGARQFWEGLLGYVVQPKGGRAALAREDYASRQAARRAAGILPGKGERSQGCAHGIPVSLFDRGLGAFSHLSQRVMERRAAHRGEAVLGCILIKRVSGSGRSVGAKETQSRHHLG